MLITDNESAMLVCGRTLANNLQTELDCQTFRHYRCSAHILNLAARHGLEIVDHDVVNIRTLMSKIKGSTVLCDELKELCNVQKLDYLKPELDIVTRWNSTYYMLKKMSQMQPALRMLAINHNEIQNLMSTQMHGQKSRFRSFQF